MVGKEWRVNTPDSRVQPIEEFSTIIMAPSSKRSLDVNFVFIPRITFSITKGSSDIFVTLEYGGGKVNGGGRRVSRTEERTRCVHEGRDPKSPRAIGGVAILQMELRLIEFKSV